MAAPLARSAPRRLSNAREISEYFAAQPSTASSLPAPEPLLRNLTIGVLEVLAGVREVDQLARWMGEDAFRALTLRANITARARSARGQVATRPAHRILSIRCCEPKDAVVEAVVIVSGPVRVRAVAIRLEGWDDRWRAMSIGIL